MERFNSIYPFTTENIAGYMGDLDLNNKKIITVTGSADHIINAILKGSKEITTFDVNPLTKYYMDLKLASIKELSYEDFLDIFLYCFKNIDSRFVKGLDIPEDSKKFWVYNLESYLNDWETLRESTLFNNNHFNPNSKYYQNLYLNRENYNKVKQQLNGTSISFINTSLDRLELDKEYDYMFLSNISDYLKFMFKNNELKCYHNLLKEFLKRVKEIYFAYLYDIGNDKPRSDIDNLEKVEEEFKEYDIKFFDSALESLEEKQDGVLILRRDRNVRK